MRTSAKLRNLIGPIELLHEQAGPGLLRLARVGIFVLWIVKLLLDPLWRLAELPRDFFQPTGILALLPPASLEALLTPHGLTAFLCVTLFVLVLGLLPYEFPIVSIFAAVLLTAYSSLIRSFGPPVHTDIVLLLAVYALCAFSWADWIQTKIGKGKRADRAWSSYPRIPIVKVLCASNIIVGINRSGMTSNNTREMSQAVGLCISNESNKISQISHKRTCTSLFPFLAKRVAVSQQG